jgi:hypothetical protein
MKTAGAPPDHLEQIAVTLVRIRAAPVRAD